MVTDRGAAGKYPLTGQLSSRQAEAPPGQTAPSGRGREGGGVDDLWTELASPLLKLLNRALSLG